MLDKRHAGMTSVALGERLGKKLSNTLDKVPFKRRAFQLCVDRLSEMLCLETDEAELCNSPGSNDSVFNKSSWLL